MQFPLTNKLKVDIILIKNRPKLILLIINQKLLLIIEKLTKNYINHEIMLIFH